VGRPYSLRLLHAKRVPAASFPLIFRSLPHQMKRDAMLVGRFVTARTESWKLPSFRAEAAIVPRPQALFVELQAARCSGWQLTSLVQRHARLVTTFTRHHRREDVVAEGEALT
jgi:hypothetical protein